jgi:uncharacterized protein YjiS (DUF1127 family)
MISILMGQLAKALGQAFVALTAAFIRLIKEWQYRADIQKLQSLSDRQLSDIGLTRSRIEEAVRGGLPRKFAQRRGLSSVFHP